MNRSKPQRHRRRRVDTVVGMGPEPEAEPTAEETDSAASQASEAQPDEARSEAAAVEVIRPDPQAKTFGDEGKAWLNVQISKDKLQATLTAISYGGAKVRGPGDRHRAHREIQHRARFERRRHQGSGGQGAQREGRARRVHHRQGIPGRARRRRQNRADVFRRFRAEDAAVSRAVWERGRPLEFEVSSQPMMLTFRSLSQVNFSGWPPHHQRNTVPSECPARTNLA